LYAPSSDLVIEVGEHDTDFWITRETLDRRVQKAREQQVVIVQQNEELASRLANRVPDVCRGSGWAFVSAIPDTRIAKSIDDRAKVSGVI
jgi:hypothetical protein